MTTDAELRASVDADAARVRAGITELRQVCDMLAALDTAESRKLAGTWRRRITYTERRLAQLTGELDQLLV